MTRSASLLLLAGMLAAAAGGYWVGQHRLLELITSTKPAETHTHEPSGPVLYYRDPDGKPFYSLEPKQTPDGRSYRAVLASEEVDPAAEPASTEAQHARRRILYYRNPMGLPDTSPVPKKDPMGMDYVPVYEGEDQGDGNTVKVSLDKIQRSGVRTEKVELRVITHTVRGVGTIIHDEARLTVVAMRSDGYIEELYVNRTGVHVHAGDPLFRVYSPEIVSAQIDVRYAGGAEQRLRNLGVPESHIRDVRAGKNPLTVDWVAPATGDVFEKKVVKGQKVKAGDELYRIADHSQLWVIAEMAETDLPAIKIGTRATVTVRAYPAQPTEGKVTFIYPELRAETRTARVRIEIPNPDGRLKIDMYADVVFGAAEHEHPVLAIPVSAAMDSGTRQVVLVAKDEGRFEPRPVKLGRRGEGYVEIIEGVVEGEEVVTAANFLIDAESNLRAALQAFTHAETPK
jgi:membrane fusion protein, copper/silver efflux system